MENREQKIYPRGLKKIPVQISEMVTEYDRVIQMAVDYNGRNIESIMKWRFRLLMIIWIFHYLTLHFISRLCQLLLTSVYGITLSSDTWSLEYIMRWLRDNLIHLWGCCLCLCIPCSFFPHFQKLHAGVRSRAFGSVAGASPQDNSLIHLVSLVVWFDTECNVYFGIISITSKMSMRVWIMKHIITIIPYLKNSDIKWVS